MLRCPIEIQGALPLLDHATVGHSSAQRLRMGWRAPPQHGTGGKVPSVFVPESFLLFFSFLFAMCVSSLNP